MMSLDDFYVYIADVWHDPGHYGFNELFDTTQADWSQFDYNLLLKLAQSAAKLQTLDPESKLAWVVLEGKQKDLTDFYKSAKSMLPVKSRKLEAFHSREQALKWLES